MKRNVQKQSDIGKKQIPPCKVMTLREMKQVFELASEQNPNDYMINLVMTSFYFGYAVGLQDNKAR